MKMTQTAENQNISQCPLPNQPRPEGFFFFKGKALGTRLLPNTSIRLVGI